MNNEQRTDLRVGVTVLLGIVVLLAGIAWAKGWHFGGTDYVVRASFVSAGGLEVGDPVTINGIKRGAVSSVDLRDSDVLVAMTFPKKVDLRRDAQANIMMLELMGGKKIELLSGSSPIRLASTAIIPGSYSGDIGTLVAMVTSLSGTMQSITVRADTLIGSLNNFFQGNDLKENVNLTMSKAQTTLSNIDRTANSLSGILAANGPTLKRTLEQADVATRDLSQTLSENRPGLRTFIDSTGRAVAEARSSLAKADRLFVRFDSLLAGTNSNSTLFNRLMKDEGFARRLDTTLTSLNKLMEQIRLQGIDANIRFFNSTTPK